MVRAAIDLLLNSRSVAALTTESTLILAKHADVAAKQS